MLKSIVLAATLGLLAACATTAPPEEIVEVEAVEETRAEQIERLAMEQLALEPDGSLPPGLQDSILEIEEQATGLFYQVELLTSRRRRGGENYVLYGQCPPSELARCAEQIVAAARMLRN